MSEFLLSPAARLDLLDIWEYIARDSVEAADRVIEKIHSEMRELARQPGLGHFRRDLAGEPLRFWRVYTYLAAMILRTCGGGSFSGCRRK
jgi:plasmid stabilization system protein ParE